MKMNLVLQLLFLICCVVCNEMLVYMLVICVQDMLEVYFKSYFYYGNFIVVDDGIYYFFICVVSVIIFFVEFEKLIFVLYYVESLGINKMKVFFVYFVFCWFVCYMDGYFGKCFWMMCIELFCKICSSLRMFISVYNYNWFFIFGEGGFVICDFLIIFVFFSRQFFKDDINFVVIFDFVKENQFVFVCNFQCLLSFIGFVFNSCCFGIVVCWYFDFEVIIGYFFFVVVEIRNFVVVVVFEFFQSFFFVIIFEEVQIERVYRGRLQLFGSCEFFGVGFGFDKDVW